MRDKERNIQPEHFELPIDAPSATIISSGYELGGNRLGRRLHLEGFRISFVEAMVERPGEYDDGYQGIFGDIPPDIILLIDNSTSLAELSQYCNSPIIVISKDSSPIAQIKALEEGATDFFVMSETEGSNIPLLKAKIDAQIRQFKKNSVSPKNTSDEYKSPEYRDDKTPIYLNNGNLEINQQGKFVRSFGRLVVLSQTEWKALHYLSQHPNEIITYEDLINVIFGKGYARTNFRELISRLRFKLGENRDVIKTIRGRGLILSTDNFE